MAFATDIDLSIKDIGALSSPEAIAGFFNRLGYSTGCRKELTATSLGLTGDTAQVVNRIELIAADADDFFRVMFARVKSITAKTRNELARKLGQSNIDHLIVMASDFEFLEFVLVDKRTRQHRGPGGGGTVQIIPRTITVNRKGSTQLDRRILRRLSWTGRDALDQFAKLRSVFESAAFSSQYFQNRALFADHYLQHRLRENAAWSENPSSVFSATKACMTEARQRWTGQSVETARDHLYEPIWSILGYKAKVNKVSHKDQPQPHYILNDANGNRQTVAFVYQWDRWLDGPDANDVDATEENPGAAVVSALNDENTRWAMVTNGKLWRLYSRDAHSRSTNYYEVDLEEALIASDETDPNEAFRYWWLFFRAEAFQPIGDDTKCWLDSVVQGSRDYAKRLGDRLKERIFIDIFPYLADGFLADRKGRLGEKKPPTNAELSDIFQATLTLLYRLLFLLYAEARDLLPVRESPYWQASLKRIKEEIAEQAGGAESNVADLLTKAYDRTDAKLYDRLSHIFAVMDNGDPSLNVPCYNGGLFSSDPKKLHDREDRIARFLIEHKVPDFYLALAIDRLSRDVDDKTLGLVFIDYKSLEVRHLGSIYEGLLEFKLKIAEEDLTTLTEKKKEKYIPLLQAKSGRGKRAAAVTVRKGEVYLSNDKAERKASGSYYTPDPVVEYIVEHTVGPVLKEKLDGLRDEFRDAAKTFHRHIANGRNNPGLLPSGSDPRIFAGEKTYAEHKGLVDQLFDFKVLDPAMGSGHFLVEAVDFITDALLDYLNRFPNNPVVYALERTRGSILEALGQQGVTVDANKLTDVNLLKRHVLKRCIYGVDLNPMAVELAKVSLWLDAFTLGAPLSFLDHHLRCGNSLIGATFKGLEAATQGQLFSIDYQPLLDAIRNVLFVNAMADATTAEVHESVRRYGDARKALSGYKIVFDLLVADHFMEQGGDRKEAGNQKSKRGAKSATTPKPSSLLTHAQDLDLSTRESFVKSLGFKSDREMVAAVEDLADRLDRRFFHWEIEFPEVFFGFEDPDQRRIKFKDEIEPGSAGFHATIGNPPWGAEVDKSSCYYFAAQTTTRSRFDTFVLFLERTVDLSRREGRVGLLLPTSWLTVAFYAPLRRALLRVGKYVELGYTLLLFDDVNLDTIAVVFKKVRVVRIKNVCATDLPIASSTTIRIAHPGTGIAARLEKLSRGEWSSEYTVQQENWDKEESCPVDVLGHPHERNLLQRLARYVPRVGDYFKAAVGLQAYHRSIHSENQIRDRVFHAERQVDSSYAMQISGNAVRRYWYSLREAEWISLGNDLYCVPDSAHFSVPRVLIQEIVWERLAAAYIEDHLCHYKSILSLVPKSHAPPYPLHALLGVLNSAIIAWYFVRSSNKLVGDKFPKLSIADLERLPLPDPGIKVRATERIVDHIDVAFLSKNAIEICGLRRTYQEHVEMWLKELCLGILNSEPNNEVFGVFFRTPLGKQLMDPFATQTLDRFRLFETLARIVERVCHVKVGQAHLLAMQGKFEERNTRLADSQNQLRKRDDEMEVAVCALLGLTDDERRKAIGL